MTERSGKTGPERIAPDFYESLDTAMLHYRAPKSLLSPRQVRALWSGLAADIKTGRKQELLSIYVHVPFCAHRCKYCMYFSEEPGGPESVERFLRDLLAEMAFMAPALKGVKVTHLYVGGGTPSTLSPEQLDRVLSGVFSLFKFGPTGERGLECHPLNMTPRHLAVIKKHGLNRVSFGVQTLNRRTLSRVNRDCQTWRDIVALQGRLKRSGIPMLNIDLLLGLTKDTPAAFLDTADRVMKLGPGSISVHRLVPQPDYLRDFYGDDNARCVDDINRFARAVLPGLKRLADRHGFIFPDYDPSHYENRVYTMLTPRYIKEFEKEPTGGYTIDNVHAYSVLGLGPSAKSNIFGYGLYHAEHSLRGGFSPDGKKMVFSRHGLKYEMLWHMVFSLDKHNNMVPGDYMRRAFAEDYLEVFRKPLAALSKAGAITIKDGDLHLNYWTKKARFLIIMFLIRSASGRSAPDISGLGGGAR